MEINHYSGILYDIIYYNVIYFNKERVHTQLKIYAEKEEDIFAFYDEFRNGKNSVDPSESLYPFFFYEVKCPCVMTEYFRAKFDFFKGTKKTYFDLFKDINSFKRYVVYFYLEKYKDINIEAVINGDGVETGKALVAMRSHGERANTFIDLFYNFERLVEDLMIYLKRLYHQMNLFHVKKKGLNQDVIDKFCNSYKINILKKSYGMKDEVKILKQTFSVCFMNPYITLCRYKNNDLDYSFIIGYKNNNSTQKDLSFRHVTYETAANIFSNKIINDIVKALAKEELTITKLSIKLNISRPTTDRLIGILYDELAVQIVRTNGNEKYYGLNPEYLLAAKTVLDQEIDDIIFDYKKSIF